MVFPKDVNICFVYLLTPPSVLGGPAARYLHFQVLILWILLILSKVKSHQLLVTRNFSIILLSIILPFPGLLSAGILYPIW
jgi:hypothetical protein